jgi:hypothetical protein
MFIQLRRSLKAMKKLAALSALGFLASGLFAQGLTPPGGQTKESWEEINFEFNSSVLSDGYPSLLRLADLLNQHKDYRVKITGNTDFVGSVGYNDKLALARANGVRDFLVKYGASAEQLSTSGNGKRDPAVDNRTKEGRFVNRRVTLTVTDGQGKIIGEGSIKEVLPAMTALEDMMKKQQDCCDQILKRLDKLDDILGALKNLQGENDKLRGELADLRNQQNSLRDQVNGLPKPLTQQQTETIAHNEAQGAVDETQRRNKKFSLLNVNVGPTYGAGRTGNFSVSGRGRFFSPFGGEGTHAVQAQGEYMYYPGRQEGQFDLGLVNRWKNLQAGVFGSFKYINFSQYHNGGSLGQADLLVDYLFSRGRIGAYVTHGFKNYAVLNSVQIAPGAYLETFARVLNTEGVDAMIGVWGNAYLEGNIGYLRRVSSAGSNRPGGSLRLVQPLNSVVAFTAEVDYNETLLAAKDSGRVAFGLQVGNYIHPKEFAKVSTPVPMDVPRIRYEFGTRRAGSSPPVADAGANQINVAPGNITLNGSGSYDPLGETLTYSWTQVNGPSAQISNANAPVATFTASAGQSYGFRLTVKNTDGLQSSASTTVSTTQATQVQISSLTASPAAIQPGQNSTLSWSISNATGASIAPEVGSVDPKTGSVSVTPSQTTTYTLTATGPGGPVTQSVTVTVGAAAAGNPQVLRFAASPVNISPGQQSTLSWTTSGATQVTISGLGSQPLNGSATVSPAQTTSYTLTATSSDNKTVTAVVTVTVGAGTVPQVLQFVANPSTVSTGQSSQLCWQVSGATSIAIAPGGGSNLNPTGCIAVSPSATTTYTLTATNAAGQIQANATINVGAVQILSFTANPVTSTYAGQPVTLSWTTQNATSVILIGADVGPMTLSANGSTTVAPITNSTYTLTAYGPGGQTVSDTISVFVR